MLHHHLWDLHLVFPTLVCLVSPTGCRPQKCRRRANGAFRFTLTFHLSGHGSTDLEPGAHRSCLQGAGAGLHPRLGCASLMHHWQPDNQSSSGCHSLSDLNQRGSSPLAATALAVWKHLLYWFLISLQLSTQQTDSQGMTYFRKMFVTFLIDTGSAVFCVLLKRG